MGEVSTFSARQLIHQRPELSGGGGVLRSVLLRLLRQQHRGTCWSQQLRDETQYKTNGPTLVWVLVRRYNSVVKSLIQHWLGLTVGHFLQAGIYAAVA